MLVLMSGVSGVGKTTITTELARMYNWEVIPTYMTRPLRPGEVDKISLTQDEFLARKIKGEFFCVDIFYSSLYAVLTRSINQAVQQTDKYWVIDRPITKLDVYEEIPTVNVIILPENESQLKEQIMLCGRSERLSEALQDYNENYLNYYSNVNLKNTFIVINYKNQVVNVATKIQFLLENNPIESHRGNF